MMLRMMEVYALVTWDHLRDSQEGQWQTAKGCSWLLRGTETAQRLTHHAEPGLWPGDPGSLIAEANPVCSHSTQRRQALALHVGSGRLDAHPVNLGTR